MNLAAGYIAQTLQTHDELVAARVNEHRRNAADRRADRAEQAARAAGMDYFLAKPVGPGKLAQVLATVSS